MANPRKRSRVSTGSNEGSPPRELKSPSAVILTALDIEYAAVRSHLVDLKEIKHPRGTLYEVGYFDGPNGAWTVAIGQAGVGNNSAAVETERAVAYFDPDVILFVGVGGGLKDVKIGDVVAATKVYGYESGKAKLSFQTRPDVGTSSYSLVQRARTEGRQSDWLQRLSDKGGAQAPRVFVEPIAAGEKVVADNRSAVYKFLSSEYSDALAVEMEGRGFLEAAYANQQVEAIVIRGISDLISNKRATDAAGFQRIAAQNASAFAFQILATMTSQDFRNADGGRYTDTFKQGNESSVPRANGRGRLPEKPRIAITMGDANGIGPEIVLKALANDGDMWRMCIPIVIGSIACLQEEMGSIWSKFQSMRPLTLRAIADPDEARDVAYEVSVISVGRSPNFNRNRRQADSKVAQLSAEYTRQAVRFAKNGKVAAIVSGPVSKEALLRAREKFRGHVELIANELGSHEYAVIYLSRQTAIATATGHVTLREALESLDSARIASSIIRAARAFDNWRPNQRTIGVCSINPHVGEGGKLGVEDLNIVLPAVRMARRALKGFTIEGPLAADAVFRPQLLRKYKLVIAMYHDQGKAAVAALGSNDFVGAFAGEGLTRTTVTHGTAFDIAGRGTASPANMITAIKQAVYLSSEGSRFVREIPDFYVIGRRLNENTEEKDLLGDKMCELPEVNRIDRDPLRVLFGPGSTPFLVGQHFLRWIRSRPANQQPSVHVLTNNLLLMNYITSLGSDFKGTLHVLGGELDPRQNSLGPTVRMEDVLSQYGAEICVISCSAIDLAAGKVRLSAYTDEHRQVLQSIVKSHREANIPEEVHPLIILANGEKLGKDQRFVYATSDDLPDNTSLLLEFRRDVRVARGKAAIEDVVSDCIAELGRSPPLRSSRP